MLSSVPDSPAPIEATPKTISRPALLTLTGIYSATKSVYATYIPAAACDLIEGVATKIIVNGSPFLVKALDALPESKDVNLALKALAGTVKSEDGKKELKALFDKCDANGDGRISRKEWGAAVAAEWKVLAKYFGGSTKADMRKAFKSIDVDGSNDLTFDEFEAAVKAMSEALPEQTAPVKKADAVPSSLTELDALISELLATGDSKIDALIVLADEKVQGARASVLGRIEAAKLGVAERAEAAKGFVLGKYDEVGPLLATRVESARGLVLEKMEDPRLEPWVSKVKVGVEAVKENAEPAKVVISQLATKARAEISEKGVVSCAHTTAEFIKNEGVSAFEKCKEKGIVEVGKEISSTVIASVKSALDEAKNGTGNSPRTTAEEIYSSGDEKAEDE
mmetsp:Transcript_68400/g.154720  ORF Transcript_68400/g.154720 Transcript_68400/m.154720 type:complete len:395 (+) Transcript_68400:106-1290(+)